MAFQTPITIKEAINNVHTKNYLLPAIQREVVWDTGQIERLFDSLMRDYYTRRVNGSTLRTQRDRHLWLGL